MPPHPPDSPSAPVNVTVRHLKANSAVVSWDVLEDEVVIGFAISQQVMLHCPRGEGHIGIVVADGGRSVAVVVMEKQKGNRNLGQGR